MRKSCLFSDYNELTCASAYAVTGGQFELTVVPAAEERMIGSVVVVEETAVVIGRAVVYAVILSV